MKTGLKNKDSTIKNLIEKFLSDFGASNILIKDYWDGDKCAIGLTDKENKFLVYISTYGQPNNSFYVELENLTENSGCPFETVEKIKNVSVTELRRIVQNHLRI